MRGPGPGAAGRTLRRLEIGGGGSGFRGRRGGKERPPSPEGRRHPRPAAGAPALFVPGRAVPKLGGKRLGRAGSGRRRSRNSSGRLGGPGRAGAGRASLCLTAATAPRQRAAGSGGSPVPLGGFFLFYWRFGSSASERERGWRVDPARRLLLDAFSLLEMTLSSLRKTLELCVGLIFFFNCSSLTLQIENREEALML